MRAWQAIVWLAMGACAPSEVHSYNTYTCGDVPLVTLVTSDDEHLYGSAHIAVDESLAGDQTFALSLCADEGEHDHWQVSFSVYNHAPDDGGPPLLLPFMTSDEVDFPDAQLIAGGWLEGHGISAATGKIVASHGHLTGEFSWMGGGSITFEGDFTFECDHDPNFKTTFCKQFLVLAQP